MRIAILTHSTHPRGGVVHALELGDALARLGHDAVVHAPDAKGDGFFRSSLCKTVAIPAAAAPDVATLVALRRAEYCRYFQAKANRDFDVFHAGDSISANALADLKEAGIISRFARTVHHVDAFYDPMRTALQARGIVAADRHFVVSRQWQTVLGREYGLAAEIVGNGVDTTWFTPVADHHDAELQARLQLGGGPILLSIGGIEERKNSLRILQAFESLQSEYPSAQLVIAGGASLLDHSQFQRKFYQARSTMGIAQDRIIVTGPMPQGLMPALYRRADLLAFPSLKEGFGLAVLEAMACGVPVVTSNFAPFTEYLNTSDVAWCDPYDVTSITQAMAFALTADAQCELRRNGLAVAGRHDWRRTAEAHLDIYGSLREHADA
jgi:glycosyltransferase-like protein